MQELVIATRNPHKTREFAQIFGERYAVRDLIRSPEIPAIAETGVTFEQNAIIKATHASAHFSGLIVADDSGLQVDALNGGPGILSARYAGPHAKDEENIRKLIVEIARAGEDDRPFKARFRCVLALAHSGQLLQTFRGSVEGTVLRGARGRGGFGYDPIFLPQGLEQTFAEMPLELKNRISHRARAIAKLAKYLGALEAR